MKLYDYYRSTASYRVRLALNIKHISYEKLAVQLVGHSGEQHRPEYLQLNPQGLVPTLDENGHILTQSLAIIEYLEEISPTPPLLPANPLGRAQVRSMALTIACDMHPLNNLRVLTRLRDQFQATEEQVMDWYHHWLKLGFDALEKKLQSLPHKTQLCYGNEVTMADVCLIPQVFNANRFGFSMANYPIISEINAHCLTLAPFKDAAPQNN
ncbi:maleylacetoacetate isomerase [Legionella brunensis]|uniref:Glutathione S-transferase (Maleylacetoacetate isomerase) n=1 Tax=Legionella brunensis TaxID=29422 RepID=A0A0W0SDN7_9GAMM|nr:maleylacetoacetate isomerase [Legionella brunensis]KTC81495.1 glutathione S-transferase (maleylacetoacetate isomerase) [Legionella brunensis]